MIRPMAQEDVEAVSDLEKELFGPEAWSPEVLKSELAAESRYYFVDEESTPEPNDKPIRIRGYAGIWFDGSDAQIMTIGVAPADQGHHIGQALLGAVMNAASALHAQRMLLEVRVDNEPALALYKKNGFRLMGLRKRYYQPENIDAYTMECTVSDWAHASRRTVNFNKYIK